MEGDEVIRLAKQCGAFLDALANEMEVDLNESELTATAGDKELLKINAGDVLRQIKALQYGCIDE